MSITVRVARSRPNQSTTLGPAPPARHEPRDGGIELPLGGLSLWIARSAM